MQRNGCQPQVTEPGRLDLLVLALWTGFLGTVSVVYSKYEEDVIPSGTVLLHCVCSWLCSPQTVDIFTV